MSEINSGELTNAELALLNNLLYIKSITNQENVKVETYLRKLRDNGLENLDDPEDNLDLTAEEWDQIFTAIENDPNVANLTIKYPQEDDGGGKYATFVDGNNNATVVFRGTNGGNEWSDNVLGAYKTDTDQQEIALEYINSLPYNNITVTGHSKGGNKAQYVTIVSKVDDESKIDRCVAFDGQGFSPEFCTEYADEIAQYNNSITLISTKDDYVNILMQQIAGNVIYTERDSDFWSNLANFDFTSIGAAHLYNQMLSFDENGNAYINESTNREPIMTVMHEFILYLENNASEEDKKIISEWMAKVAAAAMDGECRSIADILVILGTSKIPVELLKKYFSAFIDEINPEIKDEFMKLFARIMLTGEITPTDYASLQYLIALVAQDIDSTSTNVYENNSSSNASFTSATGAYRDFSDSVREELESLVNEVESESMLDVTKWDVWYRAEKFVGHLNISNYSNDINTYYRKMIDINGTTMQNIEEIFNKVNEIDNTYKSKIESCIEDLVTLKSTIDEIVSNMTVVDVEVNVQ